MVPKLALTYSSQSGNGLLGVGWSLNGLSLITRCPRTVAQDGVKGGINYDTNDRFCLDGQRLVVVNGSYGGDGSEYRTERESFAKIVSHGSAGNGPAWFQVWTKSGQIMEYGNTDDSRIEAQGKPTVAIWALNKVSDVKGNYFTVTYVEDNPNGQFYPSRIDYTGNTGADLTPYNSVQFFYDQSRPDIERGYVAGSMFQTISRLNDVKTYAGATLVKDYRLSYAQGSATGRSWLTKVTECTGDGTCFPATTFGWQDSPLALEAGTQWGSGHGTFSDDKIGDFDGDGRMDVIQIDPTGNAYVWLSTGAGFSPVSLWGTGEGNSSQVQLGDFNGDGRTDVVQFAYGSAYVWFSTGSGFSYQGQWSSGFGDGTGILLGDFNGDGRTDAIQFVNGNSYVWLSTGTGFTGVSQWGSGHGSFSDDRLGDFDGDGRTDVIQIDSSGSAYVWLSTGTGFAPVSQWGSGQGGSSEVQLADFNGDGKTDVAQVANGNVYVWLATGTSFSFEGRWASGAGDISQVKVADFNGDGKADVVQVASGNAYVWLSTATAFDYRGQWGSGFGDGSNILLADFSGDGKTDFVQFMNGISTVWTTSGPWPDLMTAVTDGLGAATTVTYKPLTDATVYAKGAGSVYPTLDIQAPLYVTASTAMSNGVGGTMDVHYFYYGFKADLTGRGPLGFRYREATDQQTGIKTHTEYRQNFPYTGLPSLVSKAQPGGALLNQVTNTYGCNDFVGGNCAAAAGKRYFRYLGQSVEQSWDLNGTQLPTVTTNNQFDAYGNATQISVSTSDGYSKVTNNTYTNDTTNWFLGRLTRATVTSTTP